MAFRREASLLLERRLQEPRRFIHILGGPRQSGKTTLALQALEALGIPSHYATADEPTLKSSAWMRAQWETARELARGPRVAGVLVIDEVQKISGWSETVKLLWDEDTRLRVPLLVVLLGSSPLLIQSGLSESLAGRFEVIQVTHWSYTEMRSAFGWTLDQYVYYGGYPGSASLIAEPERWSRYVLDSLVETTISRDILLMERVGKPALLRQLLELGCIHSGQILSFNKMLGQLHDAGNTTTLSHYLELLSAAGLIIGVQKYSQRTVSRRASSPKLLALNTALMTATSGMRFEEARSTPDFWGRLCETSAGAHLANGVKGSRTGLFYWREGNDEVDFVLEEGRKLSAIVIRTGRQGEPLTGLEAFAAAFRPAKNLIVGTGGISLEDFLSSPIDRWRA